MVNAKSFINRIDIECIDLGMGDKPMEKLPDDIRKKVENDYKDNVNKNEILELLSTVYSKVRSKRVVRCVIYLSNGNYEDLTHFVKDALVDWREVIYWAEYDQNGVRVNDFNKEFCRLIL